MTLFDYLDGDILGPIFWRIYPTVTTEQAHRLLAEAKAADPGGRGRLSVMRILLDEGLPAKLRPGVVWA